MNLDFLNQPVDFQTGYFIVFGTAAVYAVVMLLLIRLEERLNRRAHPSNK